MIEELNQQTRERVNKAIGNIRLIATRVKRASILDATQRGENVVNLLNEFRQYVSAAVSQPDRMGMDGTFRHDQETLNRVVQAIMQADDIYSMLAKTKKASYEQEYNQVWKLLEEIHTYLLRVIERKHNHA